MCHLIVIFIQDDVCMLILLMCDGFIKLKWFHTLGVFYSEIILLSCQIEGVLFEMRDSAS